MWVEPFTGTVLKFDESCYAGDYVFDVASGERLFPVLRWGAVTAGDDVQARSDTLRIRLIHYHAATRYFPMFLLGSGLFFLALSLIPIFFKNFITHRAAQETAQKTRREAARYA
jgi:hypothetical protein